MHGLVLMAPRLVLRLQESVCCSIPGALPDIGCAIPAMSCRQSLPRSRSQPGGTRAAGVHCCRTWTLMPACHLLAGECCDMHSRALILLHREAMTAALWDWRLQTRRGPADRAACAGGRHAGAASACVATGLITTLLQKAKQLGCGYAAHAGWVGGRQSSQTQRQSLTSPCSATWHAGLPGMWHSGTHDSRLQMSSQSSIQTVDQPVRMKPDAAAASAAAASWRSQPRLIRWSPLPGRRALIRPLRRLVPRRKRQSSLTL